MQIPIEDAQLLSELLVDARDASPAGKLLSELYRTTTRIEGDDPFDSFVHVVLREHLHELEGKHLCCWCGPDEPCHADVLLELVNAERKTRSA